MADSTVDGSALYAAITCCPQSPDCCPPCAGNGVRVAPDSPGRLQIKVARIFNTYGPRMHPNDGRVVSNFIVQALLGRDITIYGDGSQTRSFCYVDDLVDGLMRLMATPDEVTGPINIGNPVEFSILELATQVIELIGSRSSIVKRPLPENDPRQRRPDISKAKKFLDWEPRIQLKEGLTRTIGYFEALLADPDLRADLASAPPS